MKRIALIGLGKQTTKDHLPAIYNSPDYKIVGVFDLDPKRTQEISSEFHLPQFTSLDDLVAENLDCALVSVPHSSYLPVLETLSKNGIHTLKEKPIAMNLAEASRIVEMYSVNDTILQVCVQRRFSKLYNTTKDLLGKIDDVYSLYAESTLNLESLDRSVLGWRADKSISGGGAALDLGYHIIDLINHLFGLPDRVYAQLNFNSLDGEYDIDDSAKIMFQIGKINANATITKIFHKKCERIRVFGKKGFIWIDDRTVSLVDRKCQIIETHTFRPKDIEISEQIKNFSHNIDFGPSVYWRGDKIIRDQIANMKIIDAIYLSHLRKSAIEISKK